MANLSVGLIIVWIYKPVLEKVLYLTGNIPAKIIGRKHTNQRGNEEFCNYSILKLKFLLVFSFFPCLLSFNT